MLLVTGTTGTVGSHLVRQLQQAGVSFRAFVRDAKRGTTILGPEVEIIEGDYVHAQSLASALVGVERVFLIAPLVPQLAQLEANVIHAAARSGVKYIVKLSTLGVIQTTRDTVLPEPRQYPLHREERGTTPRVTWFNELRRKNQRLPIGLRGRIPASLITSIQSSEQRPNPTRYHECLLFRPRPLAARKGCPSESDPWRAPNRRGILTNSKPVCVPPDCPSRRPACVPSPSCLALKFQQT